MTTGNGNMMLDNIISFGNGHEVPISNYISSGFARACLLGISMNCGFVGGFIYPLITMGTIAGTACYMKFSYLPIGLCLSCFITAIPSGLVPMPYTLTCLSCFTFSLNNYQAAPVFIATMTSYLIVSGSGILPKLQAKVQERQDDSKNVTEDLRTPEIAKQSSFMNSEFSESQPATTIVIEKPFNHKVI
jgi:H+/Cl- antiporter ClcA